MVARSFAFLFGGEVLEPPLAPPDVNPSGSGLFDLRVYGGHKTSDYRLVLHNQFTLRMNSTAEPGVLNLGRGIAPPRLFPLTFTHQTDTLLVQSDMDWVFGEVRADMLSLTIGRQPVTFGRGTIWHTNDLISTFALTEVDTEYKPGADVVRLDWSLPERRNLTLLVALGEVERLDVESHETEPNDLEFDLQGSSALVQFKQAGSVGEVSLLGGFVRYDLVASVDGVWNLDEADVYGELTGTWVTSRSLTTPAVGEGFAVKALAGAHLRPTNDLTITPEVFYNGFGSTDSDEYLPIALSERVGIGEQVAFGAFYGGLANAWEVGPLTNLAWGMVSNLTDPSALVFGSLNHGLAQDVEGLLVVYAPVGRLPTGSDLHLRSEYGVYPYFFFFELKATI